MYSYPLAFINLGLAAFVFSLAGTVDHLASDVGQDWIRTILLAVRVYAAGSSVFTFGELLLRAFGRLS
jgi:hypothetical protein